ncbi:MAG TPA: tRNA (adenosine(37)-N6)-threonylcarbamoyltransferase complex dimerization subunit type 1 TsaB [Abditibacteriaceae bacterium]|jgi:tRNA threonylcarbamoyladenosine biosynthesis protein TsaB
MKIIALEAGSDAAIAALENEDVQAVMRFEDARSVSRVLPTAFDEVLQSAGWERGDVEALAVGVGPGSWTSLRIALSTMKTWAQSCNLPLAGVPSFDAYAVAAWSALPDEFTSHDALLLVVGPSRANEIYAKLFLCRDDGISVAQAERIASPQETLDTAAVEAMSHDLDTPLIVTGAAADQIVAAAQAHGDDSLVAVTLAPEAVAAAIARLGAGQIEAGEGDPLAVEPLYLAPSAAERNLGMK